MKRILVGFAAAVLILAAGLGFFLATFDANRYKNQVAKGLANVLGSPVRIGGLSLGWREGTALEIKGLAIYLDSQTLDKPAATLERASVKVHLLPLLGKRIEVVSVLLDQPKFNVIREVDGSIRVHGFNPPSPAQGKGAASSSTSAQKAAPFFIGSVKIQGGEIGFVDRSSAMPLHLAIHRLELSVKNFSFSSPVDFKASMGIFNAAQNFHLEGRVRISGMTGPYVLENFKASTDLGTMKLQDLLDSVPALKNAGFRDAPLGRLSGTIDRLKVEGKGLSDLNSTLSLSGGKFSVESLRSPLQNVALDASATENNFQLKNLKASFARGNVTASGVSKNYFTASPQSTVDLRVEKIALQDVLPPAQSHQPQLHGNFSAAFKGDALGMSWRAVSKTLTGNGEVSLTEGVVSNLNVLRFVFDKLSQIPGVAEALNQRLPPQYHRALNQRDTVLPPLKFPVTVVNGVLTIPNLRIILDGFELLTTGQISLEGAVHCQATLVLDPELTAILAQNAPQIRYVVDANGRLTIPVKISGEVRHLKIEPDMDYVFSRVLETKGKELITNVLQKALKKKDGTEAVAAGDAATQEPSYQNILGQLLQ